MNDQTINQGIMDSIEKKDYQYEYSTGCGFSNFPDGFKFRYTEDGDICLSTDCSTWAKKLINNVRLSDYLECESLVPPEVLHFPEFGTQERKKSRKESIGNYIENCESCNRHMDTTFSFCGRLVCDQCNFELKKQKCRYCGSNNRIAEFFCNEGKVYQSSEAQTGDYCLELALYHMMFDYCSKCYKQEYASGIYSRIQFDFLEQEDDYEYVHHERCRVCGDATDGGDLICYYCTNLGF